jgi:uncharacterized protein (TIGR00297 family)
LDQELKRKLVHVGMAVFALAVGRLPNWMVVLCCLAALLMNALVLPRLTGRALERPRDRRRGFALGILMYPAVLLLLSLLFYQAQIFLVIAWAAMAFGDGFAGMIGARFGGKKLPWSSHKSWAGLFAFWFVGGASSFVWLMLLPASTRLGLAPMPWFWIVAAGVLVAGLLETIDGFVDDNLIVPLTAALISYLAFLMLSVGEAPRCPDAWLISMLLVVLFSIAAIALRRITLVGGIVGGIIAWLLYAGGGLANLALLFYFFVTGTAASQWRFREKIALGLAQENRGVRGVNNVVANAGVAGICALAGWLIPDHLPVFALMAAASLSAATSDTLSSELGNLYGKRYVNVLSFKPDCRGADGAISLEGSLFGVFGAAIAGLIYALFQQHMSGFLIVCLAGVLGNYTDSLLGATLQRRGLMTNDTVNFANTASASLAAMALHFILQGPSLY